MPEKILSIVIPTYNMEQYLPQCLDSITHEDIPNSLEAIVVNDGSTDHSLEIAKTYQQRRPDIIKIIDKPNGHYGSCINAGLKTAQGKYFRPLDADDWFNTEALAKFLKRLESTNADLIITPRTEISIKKRVFSLNITEGCLYEINILRKKNFHEVDGIFSMHSMTYKSSLLKEHQLSLSEGVCYTDTEYYLIPLQYTKNFIYFNLELYQYRLGREGQSMEAEQYEKNRHHLVKVLNSILEKTNFHPNSMEYNRILGIAKDYYGMVLFDVVTNNTDKKDIHLLSNFIKRKQPYLWKEINRALYFFPFISNITGINFNIYSKFKKIIGRRSLFH